MLAAHYTYRYPTDVPTYVVTPTVSCMRVYNRERERERGSKNSTQHDRYSDNLLFSILFVDIRNQRAQMWCSQLYVTNTKGILGYLVALQMFRDACHLPYPANCYKQRNSGVTHLFCAASSANCQTDQSRLYQASRKLKTLARQLKRSIPDFAFNDPLPAFPTTLLTTHPLFHVLLPSKGMFKNAAQYSEITFCERHFGQGQSQHITALKEEEGEGGEAHQEISLLFTE